MGYNNSGETVPRMPLDGFWRRSAISFALQTAICWTYLYWDGSNSSDAFSYFVKRCTFAIGSVVPKARRYSDYFYQHGSPDLASELIRVYGFCMLMFMLVGAAYFVRRRFESRHELVSLPEEFRSRAARERFRYIERWVIIFAIIDAYYNFIGFGLEASGVFPAETTSGANVLAVPIFGMPALGISIFYLRESRSYLTKIS